MKKSFGIYAICWGILFALFNVICFVTPNEAAGMSKFGGAFWAGYAFITLAFIGQLMCAYFAFKAENRQKLFYRIPLLTVSYTGLILTIVFGGICMAIPDLPNWAGAIVCLIVLAFTAIAVIKAAAAGEAVAKIDAKVKTETQFIKLLTAESQNLVNRAGAEQIKKVCKEVYEAVRYSDPVSSPDLSGVEQRIKEEFDTLTDAVIADNAENCDSAAKEIIKLIAERNALCKAVK